MENLEARQIRMKVETGTPIFQESPLMGINQRELATVL